MANYAHDSRFATLRQQAERALPLHDEDRGPESIGDLSLEAIREMVHELHVHQVELQLQNEELLRTRQDAEAERDRFAQLYDSVPVGCLTVDHQGVIREANRSGRLLLVGPTWELVGRRLGDFVFSEDQDAYFLFLRRLFQTGQQRGELRLLRCDEARWVAQIEARVETTGTDAGKTCRLVLSDITARKQVEDLRAQRDWLDVTLSSLGDALITIDTRGVVTFLNRAAADFTG